ncbi:MAG: DUF6496 domain-containing protein [Candidatus Paceibacterota bacterium]|jgi:hypothetical protein
MPKYGKKVAEKVKKVLHEYKRGKLKMGKSNKMVKSRKQAVAIGLSEARKEGAKMPPQKSGGFSLQQVMLKQKLPIREFLFT